MADDRLVQRLEEQLRDAHSTNADLRERLGDIEARERAAEAKLHLTNIHMRQLENAHAKQKAAEDNAAAAQRKQADAEREALSARGELEELRARIERQQSELEVLHVLDDRLAAAQSAKDLLT